LIVDCVREFEAWPYTATLVDAFLHQRYGVTLHSVISRQ